ncbi:MAG: PilN domain-containing protein [Alphaproteobacteria bacterium]|nr:PilN domain-containing protein [Alphaproteobacteria bacterium]
MTATHSSGHSDLRAVAVTLLAEWRAELAVVLREKFAGRLRDDRQHLCIDMGADEIVLARVNAGGEQVIARAPRAACHDTIAATPQARTALNGTRNVVLRFPRSSVLHLDLELPAASGATLRQAAAFELERLCPIRPDQLYFDCASVRSGRVARVGLRAVMRAEVDKAVALCRASGLGVGSIRFEGDPRAADPRVFPIDRNAFLRLWWLRYGAFALGVAAIVLLAALLTGIYLRGAAEDDQLMTQLVSMDEQVAAVHRMQRDVRDLRTQIEFPAAQKRAPLLLDVLAQVTDALPDGTWLTELQIKGGKAHISGLSKSPSDLIGAIGRRPLFSNAQFGAPLEGAQNGTERFDLSFDVKPVGRP